MPRRPQSNRAARAGLGRGLEERRLRRNAGKQALSRLELGEGLALDERSRLTTTPRAGETTTAAKALPALRDDTAVMASGFRISQITSTTVPSGVNLAGVIADLALLQTELETALQEVRENFATLTKRVNELSGGKK